MRLSNISGNITGTAPGFLDARSGDFRLAAGSAAVNAGTELAPSIDLAQQYVKHASFVARPRAGALDLGAFEFDGKLIWRIPSLTSPGEFPPIAIPR